MTPFGRWRQRALAALATLAALAVSGAVHAQFPGGGPGGPGPGGPGGPGLGVGSPQGALPQPSGKQKGPESHAASGSGPSNLPTDEAQLPEKPNEVPKELEGLLESDFDPDVEVGRDEETLRQFYGLYYEERSGDYSFRSTFPPLWLERRQGDDRASLFGLTYFNRRSPDFDADVLFPIFWHLRDHETTTTVVGPVMHRESPTLHDNWFAPFFFEGEDEEDHSSYFHIPPLLTFSSRTDHDGFAMAGPAFCSWKGGPRCDSRTADEIAMGIAPLYFYGRDNRSEYELIPPLLHYYEYEEIGDAELDVWGPLWMENSRDGGVVNLLPLFWHNWSNGTPTEPASENTTLFPFFHYGTKEPNQHTLATPLFVDIVDEDDAHTFATYLYARHRGRTELDMITPLFWQYRDPDIQLERTFALPFYYRETSNRSNNLAIFPFYGQFERYGISREWWVTPLFRHQKSITGWETDIFPFFYSGRENYSTHLVVAPILFDFATPKSRSTVITPLFWRFADEEGIDMVVGNTYYGEEKVEGGVAWQFHFFPLFSYGESPNGHWWNFLYGLAGYTREGTRSEMRAGYIPIELSE